MATRIYLVEDTNIGAKTLVRANTQAQAVRHVTKERFEVTVADQETIVFMVGNGSRVEDAAAEPIEPASVAGLVAA